MDAELLSITSVSTITLAIAQIIIKRGTLTEIGTVVVHHICTISQQYL